MYLLMGGVMGAGGVRAVDLSYGHFEVHLDYQPNPSAPDEGWGMAVSYDRDNDFGTVAGVVRMDASGVRLVAAPAAKLAIPNPAGSFSKFGAPGDPIWILPQNAQTGALFLGVRATIPTGIFQARSGDNYVPSSQGSVSLRLVSVEGSGPERGGKFATWKTESFGTVVYSMDTTDGISAADEIRTVPVSSHTHYNWGFTKPGVYRVTLEAFGRLMSPSGQLTKAQKTLEFVVPHSSVAADGACLSLGEAGTTLVDGGWDVGYRTDLGMMKAERWVADGAGGGSWQQDFRMQVEGEEVADGVGREVAEIAQGRSTAARVRVVSYDGPGSWSWKQGATVLADGAGDSFGVLPGEARHLRAEFARTGLYRMEVMIEDIEGTLPPRRERWCWLAGLEPGFSYAQWRESFENGPGGAAGALANPDGDADGDGKTHREEYAGWMLGFHPFRAEGGNLLKWVEAEGSRKLRWVRDTYRDPLNGTGEPMALQYSSGLGTWQTLSPAIPGDPTEFFETGLRANGALGRIWEQQIQFPGGSPRGWARVKLGN